MSHRGAAGRWRRVLERWKRGRQRNECLQAPGCHDAEAAAKRGEIHPDRGGIAPPPDMPTIVTTWRPMGRVWRAIPDGIFLGFLGLMIAIAIHANLYGTPSNTSVWEALMVAGFLLALILLVWWQVRSLKQLLIMAEIECVECQHSIRLAAAGLKYSQTACCRGCGRIYNVETSSHLRPEQEVRFTPTNRRGSKVGSSWVQWL